MRKVALAFFMVVPLYCVADQSSAIELNIEESQAIFVAMTKCLQNKCDLSKYRISIRPGAEVLEIVFLSRDVGVEELFSSDYEIIQNRHYFVDRHTHALIRQYTEK